MSDRDPQAAWLDAWASTQRDLWQKMLSGQAPTPAVPGPTQFMQFFGQPLPESSQDVTRKMMDFGEGYLGVAREFWKLVESTGAAGGASPEQKLKRDLEALQSSFTQGFARLYGAGPLGADLLGAWQKMAGPAASADSPMPAWPGLPALGITRERQEAMERLGKAAMRYQQALGRYGELLGRVSSDAVERLTRRITRIARPDEQIGSFRAMYDLWVECGEEAFAAAAHGTEFAKAQSDVNDALMELKAEQQKQVEDWARALDLPTRTEMNTLLKRVNTLRRRLREVEEELESGRRKKSK